MERPHTHCSVPPLCWHLWKLCVQTAAVSSMHSSTWREFMVGTKISGLTGGPSYCQPGGAGHASLSSTPLVPRGSSASRREDTALAAHRTPWHSGEHSGLYKILFPIFACSLLVISARGHTPQASNHSAMRLLIWRDALTPSVARRCDTVEYRVQRSTSRSTPLAIIPLRGGRAA